MEQKAKFLPKLCFCGLCKSAFKEEWKRALASYKSDKFGSLIWFKRLVFHIYGLGYTHLLSLLVKCNWGKAGKRESSKHPVNFVLVSAAIPHWIVVTLCVRQQTLKVCNNHFYPNQNSPLLLTWKSSSWESKGNFRMMKTSLRLKLFFASLPP